MPKSTTINGKIFFKYLELGLSLFLIFSIVSNFALNKTSKLWIQYRFFEKLNIPTPPYRFILGNLIDVKKERNDSKVLNEWTKKYGKTYGYFEGHRPILVTSDLDIIQEVYIKQFNNFSARKNPPLDNDDTMKRKAMIRSTKGRWKRQRIIINPTFSSLKLREMGPLIVKCVDRLLIKLDTDSEKEINFAQYLKRFTMDTIWNCAYGLDIDMQNDSNNRYFKNCENLFAMLSKFNLPIFLSTLFYELDHVWLFFLNYLNRLSTYFGVERNPYLWLNEQIDHLLERRKEENIYKKDYMQLLLDASSNKFNTNNDEDDMANDLTGMTIHKSLTNDEVQANLVSFMLAGYETTSTCLTYCSHILATNQEEQRKLMDEIDQHFPLDSPNITPNTDNVKELVYLEYFIKEVLRMYPIAGFNRRCTNSTRIKDIDMPVGLIVKVDHFALHYDQDLWGSHDVNEFYPLRHEDKRHPLAFVGFGIGPRNCVGMKFALVEMKIALVNILRNYEMHPTNNTPKELRITESIIRQPRDGVAIMFKKRI